MAEKIFCGSAKEIQSSFGGFLKVSMNKDDINKIVKWMKRNNQDWVNIPIFKRKETTPGKPTHYLIIDDYVKDRWTKTEASENKISEELPF